MIRRNFLKSLSAAALISTLPSVKIHPEIKPEPQVIKPRRLKKGDTIGLVSPGSFITKKQLEDSIKNIELLGFKAAYSGKVISKYGYLGGSDEERADDLNDMFRRTDVDGIICTRGGYGCSRILPLLDYDLIKNNPKVLMGYSDITSLLYGIFEKSGVVGFHGPVGISTYDDFSVRYINDIILNPTPALTLLNHEENKNLNTIRSGKAEGILVGGNLSIIVSLIGTEFDIDSSGKIIFIEEVGEEPYRIDRMLTQMIQAGKFKNAAGIALGVFRNCEPKGSESGITNSFSLAEVLNDRLYDLNIPLVYGLSFGHISNKFTLPFGVKAELNSVNQTITLLETAVN
jgi:muramoyltetrapeptide carboxypeptidase